MIKGIIFDMDGTLVDSKLDYNLIREDLGFEKNTPILETIKAIPEKNKQDQCFKVLKHHEYLCSKKATLMPNVKELLLTAANKKISTGLVTRNNKEATRLVLDRLNLKLAPIITREDAAEKPHPAGMQKIAQIWFHHPHEILVVGDYLYDIIAGKKAKMHTLFYAPKTIPSYASQADYIINDFSQLIDQLKKTQDPNKWIF